MGKLAKAKAALAEVASTDTNGATNGVTSADWMLAKKEKKKMKEEAAAVVAAANARMDLQNNVKEKKKAKKRKLEKENGDQETKIDWAQEVDQVLPLNGDSAKKKKKKDGKEGD